MSLLSRSRPLGWAADPRRDGECNGRAHRAGLRNIAWPDRATPPNQPLHLTAAAQANSRVQAHPAAAAGELCRSATGGSTQMGDGSADWVVAVNACPYCGRAMPDRTDEDYRLDPCGMGGAWSAEFGRMTTGYWFPEECPGCGEFLTGVE